MLSFFLLIVMIMISSSHAWVQQVQFDHNRIQSTATTSRSSPSSSQIRASLWASSTSSSYEDDTRLFAKQTEQRKPAFRQPNFVSTLTDTEEEEEEEEISGKKKSKKRPPTPKKYGSDSRLTSLHQERISTAGRVGTKRYVNPCKVFMGNLPYNMTDVGLRTYVCDQLGLPAAVLIHECKIIQDWKTGQSKGYGFVVFTQPMHATICISKCNGMMLDGRAITVNQGKKKDDPTQVYLKNKKSKPMDDEERAIQSGIVAAAAAEEEEEMDPEMAAVLRRLDPDLVPTPKKKTTTSAQQKEQPQQQQQQQSLKLQTFDYDAIDDDMILDEEDDVYDPDDFDDLDDDDDDYDDFVFDGDFEGDDDDVEEFDPDLSQTMNREQRRKASKGQKKKKLPAKGFGTMPS